MDRPQAQPGDETRSETDESVRQALQDSGEGTLGPDGKPVGAEDVTVLQGIDEEDWTGPTGP